MPAPATQPAAPSPILTSGVQLAVSRTLTIAINVAMTALVSKGWASQDEATQYGLILSGVLIGAVGNVGTLLWSYARRKWLEQSTPAGQPALPAVVNVSVSFDVLADKIAERIITRTTPPDPLHGNTNQPPTVPKPEAVPLPGSRR